MPELPVHSKTVELIWDSDLDDYIEEQLGRPWSLQQNAMFGQAEIHPFEVFPDPEVTAKVEEWLASPPAGAPGRLHQPGYAESVDIYTCEILNELCNRGLFPQGDITVHVWW